LTAIFRVIWKLCCFMYVYSRVPFQYSNWSSNFIPGTWAPSILMSARIHRFRGGAMQQSIARSSN